MIADPPYNERTHTSAKTTASPSGMLNIDFAHLADMAFLREALRVARQWVVCFCALEQIGNYASEAGRAWVRAGVWDRRSGAAFARADRPFQGAEGIAIMSSARTKVFPAGAKRAVWTSTIERDDRVHPTQKPIELMLEIVSDFTRPGDLVIDTHCGSGTTGVACVRLGRRFIGCEVNPAYANVARDRLESETRQQSLSAYRAGQTSLFG